MPAIRAGEPRFRFEPAPNWVEAAPGVRMRPLVEGVGTKLILYRIDPGTRFEDHRHEFGELGVVLQGKGRISVEGTDREIGVGESYFLPPNCLHGLSVAEGREPMVLVDVTTFLPPDIPIPTTSQMTELTARVVRSRRRPAQG